MGPRIRMVKLLNYWESFNITYITLIASDLVLDLIGSYEISSLYILVAFSTLKDSKLLYIIFFSRPFFYRVIRIIYLHLRYFILVMSSQSHDLNSINFERFYIMWFLIIVTVYDSYLIFKIFLFIHHQSVMWILLIKI